jgi:hypothetical protein
MIILLAAVGQPVSAGQSSEDHLVPIEKEYGSGAAYEKLWTKKLLVSPGEIARFVFLPGNIGEESAVSVYRKRKREKIEYWVTVTQPSARLWNCIPQAGGKSRIDPRTIAVDRCDLPLSDSTAVAIGKVWIAMLLQTRPAAKSESISVDSSREIFSAQDSTGRTMRAQGPNRMIPGGRTSLLMDLANSLIEYCNVPESRRADKARQIERDASVLLKAVSKTSKN